MDKIYYWKCSTLNGYTVEKIKEINSLENLLICFEKTDLLNKEVFAAFKNYCRPIQEDEINKIKLTFTWKEEPKDYVKFLKTCWNGKIFDKNEVNGIYCSYNKISIWLNKKCDIEVFQKLGYSNSVRYVGAKDGAESENWVIGAFNSKNIKIPFQRKQFYREKSKEEELLQLITENFLLNDEDPNGKGIFFATKILSTSESKKPNMNNRFVNCSIKTSLKKANSVYLKLFLSLPFSIFPKVPNIYLSYCFYLNGILEIGIYLTGNNKIFKNYKQTGDDPAILIAYKLKQIILEYLNPEENIEINIINSIPAENSFFTNSDYEFEVSNPRRRLIQI